jgi:DNA-binding transcriptional ArsR family regulator
MARRAGFAPRLDPDIARLAGALADPSRATMLDALLDGHAHPIGALARHAGITPATASGHLRRLTGERLVVVERDGREHRVRLASPRVAQLLEAIAALAAPAPPPLATTSSSTTRARELRFARTCYDHLAGVLGVAVTRALLARRWLRSHDSTFTAAPPLLAWLADHGHPLTDAPPTRRPLARACLDWSERVLAAPMREGLIGSA